MPFSIIIAILLTFGVSSLLFLRLTSPTPLSLKVEQVPDVPRLIKELSEADREPAFACEAHLDDWFERAIDVCAATNISCRSIIDLLRRKATGVVGRAIVKINDRLTVDNFRDALAREAYPRSRQLDDLEQVIMGAVPRSNSVDDAIYELSRLRQRHGLLAKRRGEIPDRPERVWISLFENLMPEDVLLETMPVIRARDSLEDLQEKAIDAEALIERRRRLSSRETATEAQAFPVTYERMRCHNCQRLGHRSANCTERKEPRPPCSVCGRTGHDESRCFQVTNELRGGASSAISMRKTRQGWSLDINAGHGVDREEAIQGLLKEFKHQLHVIEETKRRGKELRADYKNLEDQAFTNAEQFNIDPTDEFNRLKAVHQAERRRGKKTAAATTEMLKPVTEDDNMEIDDDGNMDEEQVETAVVTVVAAPLLEAVGYVQAIVGRVLPVSFLVDTGSQVNILRLKDFRALPRGQMTSVTSSSVSLSGIGGGMKAHGEISVPLKVGESLSEQTFVIADIPLSTSILGAPWFVDTNASVNLASLTLSFPEYPTLDLASSSALTDWSVKSLPIDATTPHEFKFVPDVHQPAVAEIWSRYESLFHAPSFGQMKVAPVELRMKPDAKPVHVRPRRIPKRWEDQVELEIGELLRSGAYSEGLGSWSSGVVCVGKSDGTVRVCIDYRGVNKHLEYEAYPTPSVSDILRKCAGAKVMTAIDLSKGFWQLPLAEKSREIAGIVFELRGRTRCLIPNCLQMGLLPASALFQRTLEGILIGTNSVCLIDDIIIGSPSWEEHIKDLDHVLGALSKANCFIKRSKIKLGHSHLRVFGFVISGSEVYPDPERVKSIEQLVRPIDVSGVRRFLGTVSYFRNHIPGFATLARPLYDLTKKTVPFDWTDDHEQAYDKLRTCLCQAPVSNHFPNDTDPFILETDASDHAIGAILLQVTNDGPQIIAVASKALKDSECRWPVREREAYAILFGVTRFADFLAHRPFTVHCDHESLRWLWDITRNHRLARWAMTLSNYDFKIVYKPGTDNEKADLFSRDIEADPDEPFTLSRIGNFETLSALSASVQVGQINIQLELDPLLMALPTPTDIATETAKDGPTDDLGLVQREDGVYSKDGALYVPPALRSKVISYFHFSATGGHLGINRTYRRVRLVFWWPRLKDDIQRVLQQCVVCMRRRPLAYSSALGQHVVPRIFDVVGLDYVGPIHHRGRVHHLLTMVDYATRWAEVAIYRGDGPTATATWHLFNNIWITRFGSPVQLITDNGTHFTGAYFKTRVEALGIASAHSSPYHPEGNGLVESFHQTLKAGLSRMMAVSTYDIDTTVSAVLFAYRSTPHESTGATPASLLFGVELLLPSMAPHASTLPRPDDEERLELIWLLRREALRRTMAIVAGRRRRVRSLDRPSLAVGDIVVAPLSPTELKGFIERFGNTKLTPSFSEPLKVVHIEDTHVEVQSLWVNGKSRRINIDQLMHVPKDLCGPAVEACITDFINDHLHHHPRSTGPKDKISNLPASARENVKDAARRIHHELLQHGGTNMEFVNKRPKLAPPVSQSPTG